MKPSTRPFGDSNSDSLPRVMSSPYSYRSKHTAERSKLSLTNTRYELHDNFVYQDDVVSMIRFLRRRWAVVPMVTAITVPMICILSYIIYLSISQRSILVSGKNSVGATVERQVQVPSSLFVCIPNTDSKLPMTALYICALLIVLISVFGIYMSNIFMIYRYLIIGMCSFLIAFAGWFIFKLWFNLTTVDTLYDPMVCTSGSVVSIKLQQK